MYPIAFFNISMSIFQKEAIIYPSVFFTVPISIFRVYISNLDGLVFSCLPNNSIVVLLHMLVFGYDVIHAPAEIYSTIFVGSDTFVKQHLVGFKALEIAKSFVGMEVTNDR